MTGQFQDFKSEIVARLAEHLIPFVQQAAVVETLVQGCENGLEAIPLKGWWPSDDILKRNNSIN